MKIKVTGKRIISAVLASAMLMSVCACGGTNMSKDTVNLMTNVQSDWNRKTLKPDDKFISGSAEFAVDLFEQSVSDEENSLISPLSVMLALAMTANGAEGDTLAQMENTLGGLSIDELNKYLSEYVSSLPSSKKSKISLANSIWFYDDKKSLNVNEKFLKANANYYDAGAYSAPFNEQTLKDINGWVSENTNGRIKNMLDQISPASLMYLINALTFDAEWQTIYQTDKINSGEFKGTDGTQQIEMMSSEENLYIDDGNATGFIKPYADGYSFVALLPKEDASIEDYVKSMSGESFVKSVKNAKSEAVHAVMPKFKAECSFELSDALKSMGMTDAFGENADFSGINGSKDLFIGQVVHKTYINVDERGTEAGAATAVEMRCMGAFAEPKCITLDRPFVYAIIDNETNLPIFMGTVMNVK